ncbi:hypothetical protein PV325_007952 [Microctonus aethiopoides]|nr:hypothetical protein PV325_007952 [Microctonus aethiopoides]
MARDIQHDFNRSALSICNNRAWYTGQRAEKIPHGLLKIVGNNCSSLDLSYNELTTISAIKNYNYLRELILDNNKLHDLKTLSFMPTLTTLSLNNNKMTNIDDALKMISKCCPKIEYVSLLGNPGYPDQLTNPLSNDEADYNRYRLYAIHILPNSLRFLDSRPVTQTERVDAINRGQFLRIIKISPHCLADNSMSEQSNLISENYHYSPLPQTNRSPFDHKGAYGKCHHRYSGKNSEGNRFIMNNDL